MFAWLPGSCLLLHAQSPCFDCPTQPPAMPPDTRRASNCTSCALVAVEAYVLLGPRSQTLVCILRGVIQHHPTRPPKILLPQQPHHLHQTLPRLPSSQAERDSADILIRAATARCLTHHAVRPKLIDRDAGQLCRLEAGPSAFALQVQHIARAHTGSPDSALQVLSYAVRSPTTELMPAIGEAAVEEVP
jgi:hypothetical protein